MKFKLNQGKSITLGNKEIPVSTTDGWTEIPDDDIINALTNAGKKHAQADWAQNDENATDYIKNRPFYDTRKTVLKNTIKDLKEAGLCFGSTDYNTISFIVNNEIFSNISADSYDSNYRKAYYLPTREGYKYLITAHQAGPYGTPSVSCETASGTIVENWSIYPPKITEKIHYLDPKYIEDMYYTEPSELTDAGNTYDDWLAIVKTVDFDNLDKLAISFKLDGIIYNNIIPTLNAAPESRPLTYTVDNVAKVIVRPGFGYHSISIILNSDESFNSTDNDRFRLIALKEEIIHKIPEKYNTFVFNLDNVDGVWTTDKTWDDVKKALDSGFKPNNFYASVGKLFMRCAGIEMLTNAGEGPYTFFFSHTEPVVGISDFNGEYMRIDGDLWASVTIACSIDQVDVRCDIGRLPAFTTVTVVSIHQESDGSIISDVPNLVAFFDAFDMPNTGYQCVLIGVVGGGWSIYNFETSDADHLYFYSITDGIYRRLKVSRSDDDNLDDIITIDKEITIGGSSDTDYFVLNSSTPDSSKKFKISVDDTGTLSATEIIESTTE